MRYGTQSFSHEMTLLGGLVTKGIVKDYVGETSSLFSLELVTAPHSKLSSPHLKTNTSFNFTTLLPQSLVRHVTILEGAPPTSAPSASSWNPPSYSNG